MIFTNPTQQEQEFRNDTNRQLLSLNSQLYIKQSFDKAITSMEAESWVIIAREQGFIDLAFDMQIEINNELKLTA